MTSSRQRYLWAESDNIREAQLNGNTIGGNANCSNGAVILPGEAGDPASNTCS